MFIKPFYSDYRIFRIAVYYPELLRWNSDLQAAISYIAPLVSLANLFAFAGFAVAWYRNGLRRNAAVDMGPPVSIPHKP